MVSDILLLLQRIFYGVSIIYVSCALVFIAGHKPQVHFNQ